MSRAAASPGARRPSRPRSAPGELPRLATPTVRAIRQRLLNWYDANRRDLPWRRRQSDAYAQWVAEIMLQQTRVDTVRAYYERFMSRFPTVRDLAAADHDDVLKYWEGLGYYRRAMFLHAAAQQIAANGGAMPHDAASLRELPGIGEYVAGAVASIAYGERVAAVDGNVARVLARLMIIEEDVLSHSGRERVASLAGQLVPRDRPGDFNQAWMDLGRTVCTPRSPNCPACPLASRCGAFAAGRADQLPIRDGGRRGRKVPRVDTLVGVFLCRDRWMVRRRKRGGLWSGLHEFPCVDVDATPMSDAMIDRLTAECGIRPHGRPAIVATVSHRLTHRAIRFHVLFAEVRSRPARVDPALRWVTGVELDRLSMSTAHRRVQASVDACRRAGQAE